VKYLPPFDLVKAHLRLGRAKGGKIRVSASFEEIQRMIRALLAGIQVDEAWYLQRNEDVAQGIREGTITSARQHFLDHGYFEGRAPFRVAVDEAWYLATYPDVAAQVDQGLCASAQAHFDASGYHEGRLPAPP
jgi:hypothetical protein